MEPIGRGSVIGVGSIPSLSSPEPTDPDPPIPTVRLDFSIHPPALMGTERIHRGARRRIQSDRKGIPGPIEREGVFPIEGREGRTSDRAAQPTRALLPAPLQRFEVHRESMSVVPGSPNGSGDGGRDDDERGCVREQDRFLPIANISRIMKRALPSNAKIAKDAKETVQECVSEYISFITSEASDKCQREKRKTINGDDLLWAMSTLGFEDYVEPLKAYLHRFREMEGEKANQGKPSDEEGGTKK